MFLVDSSIYLEKLRGGADPVRIFAPEFEAGTLLTCGIVKCEVLRRIRDRLVFDRIEQFFDLMQSVEFDESIWTAACGLAWRLDREGKVLPLSDILIATAALRSEAVLVSTDKHFAGVPDLEVVPGLR